MTTNLPHSNNSDLITIQATPGVNPAFDLIGLTQLRNDPDFASIDGSGFSVAIIDTGLDRTHPLLDDNYITGRDFVNGGDNPIDQGSHGTHVSGTVGAEDENIGVAPEVGLIGLQVFRSTADGLRAQNTDLETALQWVIDNQQEYNIVAVNMSLGGGFYQSEAEVRNQDITYDEIQRLEDLGVTVVSAAGNSFKDNEFPNFGAPAIISTLGVGAVWQDGTANNVQFQDGATDFTTGSDRVTSFSQRLSANNTIFAPGAFIRSTVPGGGLDDYAGTSMASPVVAGAVALMQEAAFEFGGRLLSPDEVVEIMRSTADIIYDGDDEDDNVRNTETNYPRLNIYNAVREIKDRFAGGDDDDDDPNPDDPNPGSINDPNGTISNAFLGPTVDGSEVRVVNGSIGIDGGTTQVGDTDVDIIRFEVASAGIVELNVVFNTDNRDDFDSFLRLFNQSGEEIASDDDSGEGQFSRLEVSLDPGIYYAGVSGYENINYDPTDPDGRVSGDTGNFTLEFSLGNDDPNGLISGAVPTNLVTNSDGEPVVQNGFLGADYGEPVGVADVDIFEVAIPDNGVLFIDIDTPFEDDYADTYLRIFDSDGDEIINENTGDPYRSDDDLATDLAGDLVEYTDSNFPGLVFADPIDREFFNGHTTDSFIAANVEAGETYYVAVSDYFNQEYNPNNLDNRSDAGSGGSYDLILSFANRDLNGSIPESRNDLTLPIADIPGLIGADFGVEVGDRDVDFVEINSLADGILEIDIDAYDVNLDNPVDSVVKLFDAEGNLLAVNDDQEAGNRDSLLQYPVEENQNYYVSVSGYGNDNFNPFQLASGSPGITGEYLFNARILPSSESESLSNDSVDNGAVIEVNTGDFVFGNIGNDNNFFIGDRDVDIYTFTPTTSETVNIAATTNEEFSADTFLRVFDSDGDELAFNDDASNNTKGSLLQISVEANQEYLIGVNGASEAARDYNPLTGEDAASARQLGNYGLSVTEADEDSTVIEGTDDDDLVTGTVIGEVINGKNGNDTLDGDGGNDELIGNQGEDLLFGNSGNDTLDGGLNNDQLLGGNGDDNLIGKDGDDTLDGGNGDDTMRGSEGNDTYIVDSINDIVENEKPDAEVDGIDTIESSVDWALGPKGRNVENLIVTSDRFIAGIGNLLDNQITGSNSKNRLSGGRGDDTLDGGRQEDRLIGNDGNDILIGSFADDLLEGGKGRDRFQFDSIDERFGIDTILDFNPAADIISVSQEGFQNTLDLGFLDNSQLLQIPTLEDFDRDFTLGFVYGTEDGSLAYIDTENEINLTQFAVLEGEPNLQANNFQIF